MKREWLRNVLLIGIVVGAVICMLVAVLVLAALGQIGMG